MISVHFKLFIVSTYLTYFNRLLDRVLGIPSLGILFILAIPHSHVQLVVLVNVLYLKHVNAIL